MVFAFELRHNRNEYKSTDFSASNKPAHIVACVRNVRVSKQHVHRICIAGCMYEALFHRPEFASPTCGWFASGNYFQSVTVSAGDRRAPNDIRRPVAASVVDNNDAELTTVILPE